MRRKANHSFSVAPQANIQRSKFDRSHGCKTTFDAGYLVPVLVDEALPGDTFNLRMHGLARLATPLDPIMDNLYLDSFFFAVPNRLIWDNWEKFNGAQTDPGDSTSYVIPTMTAPAGTGHLNGSLSDYFGIPTEVASLEHVSWFHRAYNLIYNEWFRDENLQDSVVVDVDDGPDDTADYALLRRGKRYDYFTSCLPWPQKGDAVDLPLGTSAPVELTGSTPYAFSYFYKTDGTALGSDDTVQSRGATQSGATFSSTSNALVYDPNGSLQVDLTSATAATINDLREAFQTQRLFERDARGGTRYTEIIQSHFGVTSPDARLQRPEYLGGGSTPVIINPIVQTSADDNEPTPLGTLGAYGTAVVNKHGFTKSFTEHCLIIGLVSVRADLNYQEGLNRMFSRSTRYDLYWPVFAHLGEQAVLNKEIYADGSANDELVFGYQERFAEYRYKPSVVTGQFRSNYTTSLDSWHLAQEFGSLPSLNASFIVENPPVDRVIADPAEPHFLFDSWFKYICARPMPTHSVPGLIDHF